MATFTPTPRIRRFGAIAALTLSLGACAGGGGVDMGTLAALGGALAMNNFNIPTSQLQSKLATGFPFNTKLAQLVDAKVSNPIMRPLPETNQFEIGMDVGIAKSLLGNALGGTIRMASGLRFDPTDASVKLANVNLTGLNINGVPPQYNQIITQLGSVVISNVLNNYSVYQVPAGSAQLASAVMQTLQPRVTANGLSLVPTQQR